MYSKFNLTLDEHFFNDKDNKYLQKGNEIYKNHRRQAKEGLKNFIFGNENIDGTSIKEEWFQMEDVDIFLSHSHQDIEKVKVLAGWLHEVFGLKVFIDSCVWGDCDDLLREIDNKYCLNKDGKTYDYNLRNYTTSHVHMMLSTALTEMIDRTECIIFYNTPASVSLKSNWDIIKKGESKITLSPWIYHELAATSLVKTTSPKREISLLEGSLVHKLYNVPNIEYKIDEYLKNMIPLDLKKLISWEDHYDIEKKRESETHPLDVLYKECISQ